MNGHNKSLRRKELSLTLPDPVGILARAWKVGLVPAGWPQGHGCRTAIPPCRHGGWIRWQRPRRSTSLIPARPGRQPDPAVGRSEGIRAL